jgi:hypothetical protein
VLTYQSIAAQSQNLLSPLPLLVAFERKSRIISDYPSTPDCYVKAPPPGPGSSALLPLGYQEATRDQLIGLFYPATREQMEASSSRHRPSKVRKLTPLQTSQLILSPPPLLQIGLCIIGCYHLHRLARISRTLTEATTVGCEK